MVERDISRGVSTEVNAVGRKPSDHWFESSTSLFFFLLHDLIEYLPVGRLLNRKTDPREI